MVYHSNINIWYIDAVVLLRWSYYSRSQVVSVVFKFKLSIYKSCLTEKEKRSKIEKKGLTLTFL